MSTSTIRQTQARQGCKGRKGEGWEGWESHLAGIKRIRDGLEPHLGAPLTDFQARCFVESEWFEVAKCCANRVAGPHRYLMEAGRKQKWNRAFSVAYGLVEAHGIPTRDHDLDPLVGAMLEG